jgi:phosphohistidine phosphatase
MTARIYFICMKTLIVIRHAKSSWDEPFLSDFDRPLNKRGLHDAPRMGKRLREKDLSPDLLLSSPAKRAISTCELIAGTIDYLVTKIKTDKALYHASEEELLKIVRKQDDTVNTMMVFGHNPGLTDFVNRLTKSRIDNIPTCGIVCISLPVENWHQVQWSTGKIDFFDFPKKEA